MPKAPLLEPQQIEEKLAGLRGWEKIEETLVKSWSFKDFAEAVAFVERLVPVADGLDHHPDVRIHWNRVELILWTHVSGGITERDFRLAEAIEATLAP